MKVSIIIFTLNEIDGIQIIIPKLEEVIVKDRKNDYEIIVVDGGSTDWTYEWFRSRELDKRIILFTQKERGTNGAYKEAMEKVTGDVVILFTPDGNSMPEAIPKLIEKIKEGYDMVIASRYLSPAKSYDDDIITRFGNWFFTKLVNFLLCSNYTDALVIYRAFRVNAISKIGVDTTLPSFGSSMLMRAKKAGLKVAEIPSDEPKRIGGMRKMKPLYNGWCELRMIFRELLRKRRINNA